MLKTMSTTVTTDATDYPPGAWAMITADGFTAGSAVMFKVEHVSGPGPDGSYGTVDDRVKHLGGEGHTWWKVTDGGAGDLDGLANGKLVTSWYVNPDDSLNETFRLTARGMYGEVARTTFTDSLPTGATVNLTQAGSTGVVDGALFSNVKYSAGTGVIDPFVRIQANGNEQGYNSGATGASPNPQFNETGKYGTTYNHALALKDVPIAYIFNQSSGQFDAYYQFLLDINENSNAQGQQYLSLDAFKIYQSNSSTLSNYNASTGTFNNQAQYLAYDLDAGGNKWVALNYDLNAGSGVGDMSVYVPVSKFNNANYVYVYSQFGQQASSPGFLWESSAGFEEWSIGKGAPRAVSTVTGSKFNDANGNGIREAGETAIANVKIYFDQNQNGNLEWIDQNNNSTWDPGEGERWTVTDASGNYTFTNVPAGLGTYSTYYVREVVPAGYTQTGPLNGTYTVGVGAETATVTGNSIIAVQVKTADAAYILPAFGNQLNFTPTPDFTITKTATLSDGAADQAGDVITYTVIVKNTGNVALTNVAVTDTFEGAAPQQVGTIASLAVGAERTFTYTYTLQQSDLDGNGGNDGKLTNVAKATAGDLVRSDTEDVALVLRPDLSITKTATLSDGAADQAGDVITYKVIVKNTGNVALTNVVVTDSFEGAIPQQLGTIASLGAGAEQAFTYTYTLQQSDLDGNGGNDGKLTNVAKATAGDLVRSDTKDIFLISNPGISISKVTTVGQVTGDGIAVASGQPVTWTYTVKNTGNVTLSGVNVTDDGGTPSNLGDDPAVTLQLVGGINAGDTNGNNKLDPNEIWTFTASGTTVVGTYSNIGTVTANSPNATTVTASDPSSYFGKAPTAGLIAPTATTVQQYIDGTYQTFQNYYASQGGAVQYSVKSGKISQTNPGVFFYFTGASGQIKGLDANNDNRADAITIKVDQSDTGPTSAFLPTFQNVLLYKLNDTNLNGLADVGETATTVKLTTSQVKIISNSSAADYGDVFVTFTPDKIGSVYLLSVKYGTSTVVGDSALNLPSSTYTFNTQLQTSVSGNYTATGDTGSIDLKAKGAALMLDGDAGEGARALGSAQMSHVLSQAMAYWSGQGLSETEMAKLKATKVDIADLGGKVLGYAEANHITIDNDAAGHGWSVGAGGVAPNKVDLLSVLVHELGHVLGHTDAEMGGTIAIGERLLAGANDGPDWQPPLSAVPLGVIGSTAVHPETHFG